VREFRNEAQIDWQRALISKANPLCDAIRRPSPDIVDLLDDFLIFVDLTKSLLNVGNAFEVLNLVSLYEIGLLLFGLEVVDFGVVFLGGSVQRVNFEVIFCFLFRRGSSLCNGIRVVSMFDIPL